VTARLMGVDTVVCGLRASIVITLTEMGLGLPGVASALNLERALEVLVTKRYADTRPLSLPQGDGEPGGSGPAPAGEGGHVSRG